MISALLAANMCLVIIAAFPGVQMVKSGLKISGIFDVTTPEMGLIYIKKKITV